MKVTLKSLGAWNKNDPADPGHWYHMYWAETDTGFCDVLFDDDELIPDGTYEMSMESWEKATSVFAGEDAA